MMPGARSMCVCVLTPLTMAACASAARGAVQRAERPRLTSIAPDSVQLRAGDVTEVKLVGTGFDTSRVEPRNVVRIGSLVLRGVPSTVSGTVVRVVIPASVPGAGESPPERWMGGRYPVTVSTPGGASDTVTIAITSSGGPRP